MIGEQAALFDINDEQEEVAVEFRYAITSYGADYPVDSIVKRIDSEAIFVPPFQRKFVWNLTEASKFVESLILGLPVPGVFLSQEEDKSGNSGRKLIVDGQQRLLTLKSFYDGSFKGRPFKLKNVQADLEGKGYDDLNPSDRLRLDDSIIHATIVRQDDPDDNNSSIYQIFERLNSGGRSLTPQEIRACIYYGTYNELLNELVNFPHWRVIFGKKENERLKEQELILRFVSLYFHYENYEKPLKSFLNTQMAVNRDLEKHSKHNIQELFKPTVQYLSEVLGTKAFRLKRGINTAVFDAVMVGLAKRMQKDETLRKDIFIDKYEELLKQDEFLQYATSGTSDESAVKGRIRLAIEKFDNK